MIDVGMWGSLRSTQGVSQRTTLERLLKQSGELSIHVNVGTNDIEDFAAIFDLLQNGAHRWQVFNLIAPSKNSMSVPIRQSQFCGLLNVPLPCLTSLHIGGCWVEPDGGEDLTMSAGLQVDAPNLRALSCELHLAIPRSPSRLRYLSITNVDLESLRPPVDGLPVELDQLVELRITACHVGAILSAFFTPILSKLVVNTKSEYYTVSQSTPQYLHLKELQWDDWGRDPAFSTFLPLCPNLTFFSDYVVGLEDSLPLATIDEPPTILLEISEIRQRRGEEERLWPDLKEVLLDSITCTEIAELLDAVPSIQRIRVLRNPITHLGLHEIDIVGFVQTTPPASSKLHPLIRVRTLMEPIEPGLLRNLTDSGPSSKSSSLSDINKALPPELLLWIFDLIYIEGTQPVSYPPTLEEVAERHKRHALLDVMLVCRSWHNLVVTSPRYWTGVQVGITEALPSSPKEGGTAEEMGTLRNGESQKRTLERQLERCVGLPIQVNVGADNVEDFAAIFDLLQNQARRWQVFNLLTQTRTSKSTAIGHSELLDLFNRPLHCLTSLHIGACSVKSDEDDGRSIPASLQVDAPNLRALSCEQHLAIPLAPSCLRFLSLSGVDLADLRPPVDGLRVELDQLVELRITECNPGAILSTFSTPVLSKLVINNGEPGYLAAESLPQYQLLKELQWYDVGPDPTFTTFLSRCPNLKVFADYEVGLEDKIPLEYIDAPPTILLHIRQHKGEEGRLWPSVTEVLLDAATCTEMAELVDALPSIRRLRVLRDPIPRQRRENRMNERQLLERLRERVHVAVWLEPWAHEGCSGERS
ncbi:hypothetical protein FRC01_011060 [Tulasnella sp. 417]|nr:hypothetical protein FRC01_011060 [Tulasnella sp. 417]